MEKVRCMDCSTEYEVSILARSSQCPHCGNILMHQAHRDTAEHGTLLQDKKASPQDWKADGQAVNEILFRYQNEWQIWNKVVENFANPNFHFAYLTAVTSSNNFSQAQERYRKHSDAMKLIADESWQAEIAEQMGAKIQLIANIRMQQEGVRRTNLFDFLLLAPFTMRHFRVVWIVLGMIFLAFLGK